MVSLPDGEKNFEDIFIRFGPTPERDGQTDGHRVTAYIALMHMHRAVKTTFAIGKQANIYQLFEYEYEHCD